MHRYYSAHISRPIIDDTYDAGTLGATLSYPHKVDIFVPQAYKTIRYAGRDMHLEHEKQWQVPVHDELGPFLVRYLQSAYSVQTPLLILGHPGSGKSLLTEIIAARLAHPAYTTVRVELRDIDPDIELQAQIEEQIFKDTGRTINWANFADTLRANPPLVILDGYDELLQSSGKVFADYLDRVRRFQEREELYGRPVRVLVTSRITLIDKARIPLGTTVVRLLEFDQKRRQTWADIWNRHNEPYFHRSGVRKFELPQTPKNVKLREQQSRLLQLAEQPLLLLMLALYDSSGNQLNKQSDIDQTVLYNSLLTRFIERERGKGDDGSEFAALDDAERAAQLDADMQRLGVAAIGMFNRQAVHIRREELNSDISYFDLEREIPTASGTRLTQADLLLGSFFFVHESKSAAADAADRGLGPAAFEFLHNTFGEFLAADCILRWVLAETQTVHTLRREPTLQAVLQQELETLNEPWFACLIHTSLHTRPVILTMLREWATHRIALADRSRPEVLAALDLIVSAQLKNILTGHTPPNLLPRGRETPYSPLPLLGHLAIYSLNLVMLRTVLAEDGYRLREQDLAGEHVECRAWDRLVQLWRSWFPLENLTGVAAILDAGRTHDGVVLMPRRPLPPRPGHRACICYSTQARRLPTTSPQAWPAFTSLTWALSIRVSCERSARVCALKAPTSVRSSNQCCCKTVLSIQVASNGNVLRMQ